MFSRSQEGSKSSEASTVPTSHSFPSPFGLPLCCAQCPMQRVDTASTNRKVAASAAVGLCAVRSSFWRWVEGTHLYMENTVDGRNPATVEVGSLSHYLQGFINPRWLFGTSSINSIMGS